MANQNPNDIRTMIRAQFEKELLAYERLYALDKELRDHNARRIVIVEDRPSTQAVASLYAKAWKTGEAIHILACEGYGEDATILARSLTNLCIDLVYICHADADQRAAQWMAAGWWARRWMAQQLGSTALDGVDHDYNSEEGKTLADKWNDVKIRQRAERAGQEHLYKIAYRHGSSFEHSDSWSVQGFADIEDDYADVHLGPSTNEVGGALFIAAFALYQVVATIGSFYGFDLGSFNRDAQRILDEGFDPPR